MQRAKLRMSPSLFGVMLVAVLALGSQSSALAAMTATGRAYELVSPADKGGFPVHWKPYVGDKLALNIGLNAAARDGEAVVFSGWGVFAGSENSLGQTYRSRRTPSGWVTTPGSSAVNAHHPEAIGQGNPVWWAADYNLTRGLMQNSHTWSPLDGNMLDPYPGALDVYLRNAADEDVLLSASDEGRAVGGFNASQYEPFLAGDGGQPIFQSNRHVIAEDAGRAEGTYNVYENDGTGTRLVSVAPGGGPADPACGSTLPQVGMTSATTLAGFEVASSPQSADGSRVAFQTSGPWSSEDFLCQYLNPAQLYLRDGNRTVHVSKSQRSEPDPDGTQESIFFGPQRTCRGSTSPPWRC